MNERPTAIIRDGLVVVAPSDLAAAAIFDIPGERLLLSAATAAALRHGDRDPRQSGTYTSEDVTVLRDALLSACEQRLVADYPQTTAERTAWKAYRKTLWDITTTYPNPASVQWPTPPDAVEN